MISKKQMPSSVVCEFDTFFSIPKEKFGFSNNARVFLGPPKFEDASIFVGQNSIVEIMIELR